jgi:hypothetical protein
MSSGRYWVKHLVTYMGRNLVFISTSELTPEIMTAFEYTMYLVDPLCGETIVYGTRTFAIKVYEIFLHCSDC